MWFSYLATNGVVIASEKKAKSILYDESTITKIENVSSHIGMTYSGMGPDYRVLMQRAQRIAEAYYMTYKEAIPVSQLVQRVAYVMQEYTHSGLVKRKRKKRKKGFTLIIYVIM